MGLHYQQGKERARQERSRREFLATLSNTAAASLLGLAFSVQGCGGGSYSPPPPPGDGYPGTNDQLLEEIEKAAFLFFWEQADSNTGQVKDRALAAGSDTRTVSSIAATGYGLAALCIGDQRGYQPHATIVTRVQNTLSFLVNTMQPMGMNGFFYHFVDMTTGARVQLRSVFDRYRDSPLRRAHVPEIFFRRNDSKSSHANLQQREVRLDAW